MCADRSKVAKVAESVHPHFARPHFARPHFARPYFARPHFARPHFARTHFARPHFARPYLLDRVLCIALSDPGLLGSITREL